MATGDFYTDANGAQVWAPWRQQTDDYAYTVRPSGTPATDQTNLNAAIAQLNSWGKGTLWIEDEVYTTGTVDTFTAPIHIRGKNKNSAIISRGAGGPWISYGNYWNKDSSGTIYSDCTGLTAGATYFTSPTYTPTIGEYVLLWANNTIQGVFPHNSGYTQRPMEVHQVEYWDSVNRRVYLADPIIDTMSTSAKVRVIPMLRNVVIENLSFWHDDTTAAQQEYARTLDIRCVEKLEINGCHILREGSGAVQTMFCAKGKINDLVIDGTSRKETVYGILIGPCNDIQINNPSITGCRHAVTTTADPADATNHRWGTPLNVVVNGGVVNVGSKYDTAGGSETSRIGMDSHPEGYGMLVNGTKINVHHNALGNYACSSRARNTIWKNVTVRSNGANSTAFLMYATGCKVLNCHVENIWRGALVQTPTSGGSFAGTLNGLVVEGSTFVDLYGPAVEDQISTGIHIIDNTCINCGQMRGGSPAYPEAVIAVRASSGHKITGNKIIKSSAGFNSIDIASLATTAVDIDGNVFVDFVSAVDGSTKTCGIGRMLLGVTLTNADEKVNYTGHGLSDNDYGYFGLTTLPAPAPAASLPPELSQSTRYFVVNSDLNTFQLSLTSGGAVVPFSTAGTAQINFYAQSVALDATFKGLNSGVP